MIRYCIVVFENFPGLSSARIERDDCVTFSCLHVLYVRVCVRVCVRECVSVSVVPVLISYSSTPC